MPKSKVAVVTGSNKGIGFAIVRGLCKNYDGDVYLTARDEIRGSSAVEDLRKEGLNPLFHQLDVTDPKSVTNLAEFLKENYGGVDVLVNNAGIAFKDDSAVPYGEQAESTLNTNFWGTLNVNNTFSPLLKSHARVVNISGYVVMSGGILLCSDEKRLKMKSVVSFQEISNLMQEFVRSAKTGRVKEAGFSTNIYAMSKVGVALMSKRQQIELDYDTSRSDIVVNACCPGLTNTDLLSERGTQTIDQGADTPVYLALLPPNITSPRGEFLLNREIVSGIMD